MKKALVIIVVVAMLGIAAAYINPLGHKEGSLATPVGAASAKAMPASVAPQPSQPPASAPSTASPSNASPYKDGTFTGADQSTFYGDVQVAVTINGGKITGVQFVQLTADNDRSQSIHDYAGPQLKTQTISVQSANIDGVSGATTTSEGYVQSLQAALDQAKA